MSRYQDQVGSTDDSVIEARIANMCGQLKCSTYDVIRIAKRMNMINDEEDQPVEPQPGLRDRCRNGHKYTPENTSINAKGHRTCLPCKRRTDRASSKRRVEMRALSLSGLDASMARHPAGKGR